MIPRAAWITAAHTHTNTHAHTHAQMRLINKVYFRNALSYTLRKEQWGVYILWRAGQRRHCGSYSTHDSILMNRLSIRELIISSSCSDAWRDDGWKVLNSAWGIEYSVYTVSICVYYYYMCSMWVKTSVWLVLRLSEWFSSGIKNHTELGSKPVEKLW